MDIGILGLGPVGKSFVYAGTKYGGHRLHIYDSDPVKMAAFAESGNIHRCGDEGEVGANADFLLCCTDMLNADALTKAAKAMKDGRVVSDDFSAKTPAYKAYTAAGRQLPYWSIHTMFTPSAKGFNDQLVVEVPVRYCSDDGGKENPYIGEFRGMMERAGARFKRIWSVRDHDKRMGRIQGATSAENICTAATLARLGISPIRSGGTVYSNALDGAKFLMALRAIGEKGSSNPRVYGPIAMMNPYSRENIAAYLGVLQELIAAAGRSEGEADAMLMEAMESLGWERVREAGALWDRSFGPISNPTNSYSSHLAEAVLWSRSEYPLEIFTETPSPPYRMREVMALRTLLMHKECVRNMRNGGANDSDFMETVRQYRGWADLAAEAVGTDVGSGWEHLKKFERAFFDPVREAFPEELAGILERTNTLIGKLN